MDWKPLAKPAVCLVTLLGVSVAHGVPVLSTQARITVNGSTTGFSATSSVGGQISSNATGGGVGGNVSATASETGVLTASTSYLAAGGQSNIVTMANVGWSETYTADGTGLYTFDFFLPGASLGIEDYGFGNPLTASYLVTILLDGAQAFFSSARLTGNANGGNLTLAGTELNRSAYGGGFMYGWDFDPFAGSLDLGIFNLGDTFTLDYLITVSALGPGTESGASASIGDPSNLGGNRGISLGFTPVAVSAPGTGLLFVVGLMVLGVFRPRLKTA